MQGVISDFAATFERWRVWWIMGVQDIRLRYRRSAIGPFWISLSMAAMVFGIALLYSQIFDTDFKPYLAFLGASFLVWGFISGNMVEGCSILTEADYQLRAIRIPTTVLAARMIQRNLVIFAHNVLVIAIVLAISGVKPTAALIAAPAGVLVIAAVGFFVALTLGPATLRFRDVQQIVASFMQVMFFLTPIIWMPSQGRLDTTWVEVNPFYHLLEIVRAPLLGAWPTAQNWIYALATLAISVVLAAYSTAVSRRKIYLWL